MPVIDGGLGVRRAAPLASSAYLATAAAIFGLQSALFSMVESSPDEYWEEFIELRRGTMPELAIPYPTRQSPWDRPVVEMDKAEILLQRNDLVSRTRLDAAAGLHSADWLMVMPIASCGPCPR